MANAATNLMNNLRSYKTYQLKYPVATPDGGTITEVALRRLKGSDQAALESQNFDFEKESYKITKFFLTRLSNLIPEDIDEFDQADLQELSKLITDLVNEGKSED
ncbi:phage tail assembly protein [Haemophilus parahaemolyticus]